ncbi:hypothetical protein A1O3_01223 [Capronia epimyces CBS 606.96]|uniref:Uncharacterized protein n=1 Tax=Capronia epimyces CBS 606.96 TaxID=1182542 RepID=W9YTT5_9EURO|nr:uncharacterized protein A1O3_01223 [Capronia epimyces CBS 606.96]EXJ92671.1 hypothetical protein A1O3_01223 [Capronia epimyces CBS 606.96]
MKAFIAIPALFAASALAAPEWSFTFTFSDAHSTWTSFTYASEAPNATTTASAASSAWTGPTEWISTTSYTAVFSSGTSTWGVPTAVSYSVGEDWTSMIPAPTSSTASSETKSADKSTTVAPTTSAPASSTSASPSAFTGAAAPNVNGKLAGVGAVAMAGLALVL